MDHITHSFQAALDNLPPGILNTVGEVLIGWVGDQPWMSTPLLYCLCMLCCGGATALMPLVSNYSLILGKKNCILYLKYLSM